MNKIVLGMLALAAALLAFGLGRSWKWDLGARSERPQIAAAAELAAGQPSPRSAAGPNQIRWQSDLEPADAAFLDQLFAGEAGKRLALRSLQADYPVLQAKMEAGDLQAARALANALFQCSEQSPDIAYSPESWSYYQSRLAQQKQTGAITEDQYQRQLAKIWYSYQICGNVSETQRQQRRAALQRLAESGDRQALYQFSFLGRPADPDLPLAAQFELGQAYVQTAERLLQRGMAEADPEVFDIVAWHYSSMVVVGDSRLFGSDSAKFYAHTLVAKTLRERHLADPQRRDLDRAAEAERVRMADALLQRVRENRAGLQPLSAEQLAAAEAEANVLLQACCG